MRPERLLTIGILAALSFVGTARSAEDPGLDELLKDSPFDPPSSNNPAAPEDLALELRGLFTDEGKTFFSFYETSSKTSHWLGINEPGRPYLVRSYREATDEVEVEYQNRVVILGLKQARVGALEPGSSPGPGPQSIPGYTGAVAPTPVMPPEEAARLLSVSAEIKLRREQRAQIIARSPTQSISPK